MTDGGEGLSVWGALVEFGRPSGVASLLVLSDGTANLYVSPGSAILGAGDHDSVAEEGRELLAAIEDKLDRFDESDTRAQTRPGRIMFIVFAYRGRLRADVAEADLVGGHHPLSPIYQASKTILSAVSEVSKQAIRERETGQSEDHDENRSAFPSLMAVPTIVATVPDGWAWRETLTLIAPSGEMNAIVSSEAIDPNIDAARYAASQGESLASEFPGYEEVDFYRKVVFGRLDGYLRRFSWRPPDGVRVTQIQLYAALHGRGYTATATAPTERFDQLGGLLEAALLGVAVRSDVGLRTQPPQSESTNVSSAQIGSRGKTYRLRVLASSYDPVLATSWTVLKADPANPGGLIRVGVDVGGDIWVCGNCQLPLAVFVEPDAPAWPNTALICSACGAVNDAQVQRSGSTTQPRGPGTLL